MSTINFIVYATSYLKNSELSVCEYGWHECEKNHSYGPSKRDFYLLHMITQGEGIFEFKNKTYSLSAGDMFLITPNEYAYYKSSGSNPWSYYWIGFKGAEAEKTLRLCGFQNSIHIKNIADLKPFIEIFELIKTCPVHVAQSDYMIQGYLYLIIGNLIGLNEEIREYRYSDTLNKAIDFIQDNYAENITVCKLSKLCNLDRSQLYRKFMNEVKISPQDYIKKTRINKSLLYFKFKEFSLEEIALKCGFNNYPYYSKVFKQEFETSPAKFRKKLFEKYKDRRNETE